MIKYFLFIGAQALAADGAHGGEGIPEVVIYQAINFLLFAVILVMGLRGKVVSYFSQRRDEYMAAVTKFEHAKREAEKKTADLKVRMEHLEQTAKESVTKAKSDATEMQTKIVTEAKASSEKIQNEARRTVDAEVARAVRELREEILRQATDAARNEMKQHIKEQDQQRLQREFVEKIQVVQQ